MDNSHCRLCGATLQSMRGGCAACGFPPEDRVQHTQTAFDIQSLIKNYSSDAAAGVQRLQELTELDAEHAETLYKKAFADKSFRYTLCDNSPPGSIDLQQIIADSQRDKLQAIKTLRLLTNLGLREAKDIIELALEDPDFRYYAM